MAFREVDVIEVREVLRWWLDGAGLRTIAGRAGVDRKTARRYVEAAQAAGLTREAGQAALCDELLGAVIAAVRPARPNGHGTAWDLLAARKDDITKWVKDGLTIVKIEVLLTRSGTTVPYRTLHRFATEECGFPPAAGRRCECWTVSRGWNVRSISHKWVSSPTRSPADGGRCTR